MRYWLFLLFLIPPCGVADKRKTPVECAAIARYNDHVRAEVRGQKPGELEPECAPPKKVPAKAQSQVIR